MKRFFIKGIIFTLIGYLILFISYNYLVTGHDDEKYLINKFLKNKDKIEAIAVGTSHVWAINFKSLGIEGIGLGLGGRDLTECKYILEFLISQKNNNISTVFISISYFSLYQDNNSSDGSISDARAFMYNNIPSWKMLEGDLKNYILGKFFPFVQSDHWRAIAIRYFRKLQSKLAERNAEVKTNESGFQNKQTNIPLNKVRARVDVQLRLHRRAKQNKKYDTKRHNLTVITQICTMLKERGISVIFFTPPYYYKYTELYKKQYIKEIKREMGKIARNYHVRYLDFSVDPDFVYKCKYFQDPDHINLRGTKILAEKIEAYL